MWLYTLIGMGVLLGLMLHDIPIYLSGFRKDGRSGVCPTGVFMGSFERPLLSGTLPMLWTHLFWILVGALTLMAALRFHVGIDTFAMRNYFDNAPLPADFTLDSMDRDNGGRHVILYSIAKTAGADTWLIQTVCALILNIMTGLLIIRHTRQWFTALGFYLCFAYINLNFEIMYQGAATGVLIWSYRDFRDGHWGRFYLKLLAASIFHLSVLALAWMPLLRYALSYSNRETFIRLAMSCVIIASAAFIGKWMLINHIHIINGIPLFDTLHFNSSGIREGMEEYLSGSSLNWKGNLRHLIIYVALPVTATGLLLAGRRPEGKEMPPRRLTDNEALGIILTACAAFQLLSLELKLFSRLSFYLYPFLCVGLANSIACIRRRWVSLSWGVTSALASVFVLYYMVSPAGHSREGHVYEYYIPYSNWLDKGLSHHREWLFESVMHAWGDKPYLPEETFYYSLDPGTYYIDEPVGGQHITDPLYIRTLSGYPYK